MNAQMTKNYKTDGGDRTVIGGVLEFTEDAQVINFPSGGAMKLGEGLTVGEDGSLSVTITPVENQATIETTDISQLVLAFNQLLSGLKEAGLMVPDTVEEPGDGTETTTEPDQSGGGDATDGGTESGNDTPVSGDDSAGESDAGDTATGGDSSGSEGGESTGG